jgi:transposase-like protein
MSAQSRERRDEQDTPPDEQQAPRVVCPFCGSTDTELIAPFGSQLSTSQYQCRTCHTYFERMKQDDRG